MPAMAPSQDKDRTTSDSVQSSTQTSTPNYLCKMPVPGIIQGASPEEVVSGDVGAELPAHRGWLLGRCVLLFAWHGRHPIKAFLSACASARCSLLPDQISLD